MRKYVIGAIAGALLMIGVQAGAESISKLGKRITNEYVVKLDGKPLPVTAVAFEGTSYAPVRAIGNALGLEVDFVDNEVILISGSRVEDSIDERTTFIKSAIFIADLDIQRAENDISKLEAALEGYKDYEQTEFIKQSYQNTLDRIEGIRKEIEGYEQHKEKLQKELAELEAELSGVGPEK